MSDDPIDVTSTDKASSENAATDYETIKCSYCGCLKDGVLMFYCDQCHKWVHANCLHSGPPSVLLADNHYIFKCINCSTSGKEEFERMKLTWLQVVTLALYNLSQTNLGKQGCFKWKEDICVFIEKYFDCLFGPNKKKTQWYATVASVLSAGNPHRFQSGYSQFGETGWWRLVDPITAPEYNPLTAKPVISVARGRCSRKTHFGMTSRHSNRKRQHTPLALQALEAKAKLARLKDTPETASEVTGNKLVRKAKAKVVAKTEMSSKNGSFDSHASNSPADLSLPDSPASSFSNDSRTLSVKEARVDPLLPLAAISDEENDHLNEIAKNDEWEIPTDSETVGAKDVMDSNSAQRSHVKPIQAKPMALKPMSLYDEHKLLKKLLSLPSTDNFLEARCLRRKLLLRQKKRELGIPVFNFDATVRRLHAKEKGLTLDVESSLDTAAPTFRSTDYRILDRFLAQDMNFGKIKDDSRTFLQKLVGSDDVDTAHHIVSPYTQRVLKPYIRRDYETKPARLKLLEEIVSHHHRKNPNWQAAASSPIDYCYVHPRHIPTINALCRHFFWPGVDLSESLQYPDFSVVALYKKMVIGFGFLVPDVAFNEAYISFLLVHPDWQRAGIGSFMLYHLIQTCMGKDLTLHVSASNPAMLLYQRFGFKPEKFEADFYDKYLPVDTQECKHAFFLRLRR